MDARAAAAASENNGAAPPLRSPAPPRRSALSPGRVRPAKAATISATPQEDPDSSARPVRPSVSFPKGLVDADGEEADTRRLILPGDPSTSSSSAPTKPDWLFPVSRPRHHGPPSSARPPPPRKAALSAAHAAHAAVDTMQRDVADAIRQAWLEWLGAPGDPAKADVEAPRAPAMKKPPSLSHVDRLHAEYNRRARAPGAAHPFFPSPSGLPSNQSVPSLPPSPTPTSSAASLTPQRPRRVRPRGALPRPERHLRPAAPHGGADHGCCVRHVPHRHLPR